MKQTISLTLFHFIVGLCFSIHSFAQTPADAINSGTQWLLSARYGMGIWAFSSPPDPLQEEFTADDFTPTYVRDTLEAVKALQTVNPTSTEYEPTINWVEFSVLSATEQFCNKIQILSKAGKDVTSFVDGLATYKNTDGGFGGAKGYPSNAVDTSFALQALATVQYTDTTVINNAISHVISAQNPDGGFGFYQGKSSNTYMTALVSSTLQQFQQTTSIATAVNKATTYLINHQNTDGGFGSSSSTVYETAHAYIALVAVSTDATVLGNAIAHLTASQSADGSWLQDPYSTALALRALYFHKTNPLLPLRQPQAQLQARWLMRQRISH